MPSVFSFMVAPDFFFLFSKEFRRDFWTVTHVSLLNATNNNQMLISVAIRQCGSFVAKN